MLARFSCLCKLPATSWLVQASQGSHQLAAVQSSFPRVTIQKGGLSNAGDSQVIDAIADNQQTEHGNRT